MSFNRGEEVHAEISSSDASGGEAVGFVDAGGVSRPIVGSEAVHITDINLVHATGGTVNLSASNGDITKTLFAGTVGANGGLARVYNTPFLIPSGFSLTLTAAAGQVDLQLEGAVCAV